MEYLKKPRPIAAIITALMALFSWSCATKSDPQDNLLFKVTIGAEERKLTLPDPPRYGVYSAARHSNDDTPWPRYDGGPQGNVPTYYQSDPDGIDWWAEFEKARPRVDANGDPVLEWDLGRWRDFVFRFRDASRGDTERHGEQLTELREWDQVLAAHRRLPPELRGDYPLKPPRWLPRGHRLGTWFTGGWAPSPNPERGGQPMSLGLAYWDYLGTVTPVWAGGN